MTNPTTPACIVHNYTVAEQLRGKDLHGLPCRVPEPTPEQAKCTHTREVERDMGSEDYWTGEWESDWQWVEVRTTQDIAGTNNFRCTQCGYTRRY